MSERNVTELRIYLKKARRESILEFDDFLKRAETLLKLRVEAERNFKKNPQLAKNKRHALPLHWSAIAHILNPDTEVPEETLVTQIIRECLVEIEEIANDFRKVLVRKREKVSLGMVQQIDSQCLRWLTKQPGHTAIEKAGSRQCILAVVRRENYNTLENRIFKDFVARIQNPCTEYLKRNGLKFKKDENVKKVKSLFLLCGEVLRSPIMETVGDISKFPVPNYVLRQERRYAKVWKAYCQVIRQADIAERLWGRREELKDTLVKLWEEAPRHTSSKAQYQCPIWFNYIDGKNELLDKPFFENKMEAAHGLAEKPALLSSDIIIDLTGYQPCRDLLIYGCHENAKPYLQNYKNPSIEDFDGVNHFSLNDILRDKDRERLSDYFEQLYALSKGERWFILIPDEWDAFWQESVIKSVPLSRQKVVLVWRSVAATLGVAEKLEQQKEGDTVVVIDFQQGGIVGMSKLTLTRGDNGNLIPQRKSYARHKLSYSGTVLNPCGRITKQEFFLSGSQQEYVIPDSVIRQTNEFVKGAKHVLFVNGIGIKTLPDNGIILDGVALETGVRRFITKRDQGEVSYFDELEALSLIVQTEDERVIPKILVKANEKSEGGKEIVCGPFPRVALLKQESDYVDLILCMGEATLNAPLKIKRQEFKRSLSEDHAIDLSARVTPGQGMAIVSVMSDFLRDPIELDFLLGMEDKGKNGRTLTLASLEYEMERSFPPDSPFVVADNGLWNSAKADVDEFMAGNILPDGGWFAHAVKLYPTAADLPNGASPLELLRRRNVFGNDPKRRIPQTVRQYSLWDTVDNRDFDFSALFEKLANDYEDTADSKIKDHLARLIAWTYQADLPAYKRIRKQVVMRVLDYAKGRSDEAPLYQEMTLCANLCVSPKEWEDCLDAICFRISNYSNSVSRDFYLLYNLLQFHPTIIRDTSINNSDACWAWVKHFPHWLDVSDKNGHTTNYIFKSILYFLRCRRFDGKIFLTKEHDTERYEIVSECLSKPVSRIVQDRLRLLVVEYLNNKGTIDVPYDLL